MPEDIRRAWETGRLSYRLREIQRHIKQAADKAFTRYIKFYAECSRRTGKSSFGLTWLSEDAIRHPGGICAFFAPVKEGLSDYIQPIIDETFQDCPEDLKPSLDASLTLNFPNGSKILFRGSNNKSHRTKRGNAFRRAYVDECRDVDELDTLLESVVIPSLFSTDGQVMLGSTPADTEDHDLHAIKQAAEKEGWYFHCNIYDCNKADEREFPLSRIEQWKRETTDPVAWEREYMAKWVKDPSKIIIPEWEPKYATRIQRDEYFIYYHKYTALDTGVRDKTAGIFGYYDFKRASLIIESEFCLQDSGVRTDHISKLIKDTEVRLEYQETHDPEKVRRLEVHQQMRGRWADNNNLILINDLNSLYQLNFSATRKDELPAMLNLVREWVKDGRILVDPDCKELNGCLSNAIWDKNKKELARSKVYGHFDALMALVYLVRNVDTSTNPIPKYFGKTWATHNIPANAHEPQTASYQLSMALKVKTDTDRARESFVRNP